MEQHTYAFSGQQPPARRAHVGVVGSGDLEVLLEPAEPGTGASIALRTSVDGFGATWYAVFERFFARHDAAVRVTVNDFGATPGTVSLRLAQALEAAK